MFQDGTILKRCPLCGMKFRGTESQVDRGLRSHRGSQRCQLLQRDPAVRCLRARRDWRKGG